MKLLNPVTGYHNKQVVKDPKDNIIKLLKEEMKKRKKNENLIEFRMSHFIFLRRR